MFSKKGSCNLQDYRTESFYSQTGPLHEDAFPISFQVEKGFWTRSRGYSISETRGFDPTSLDRRMDNPNTADEENLDAKNNNRNSDDKNFFCKILKRLKLPSCYGANKEDQITHSSRDENGFVEIPLSEGGGKGEVPPPPPPTPAMPVTPVDPHELCLERVRRGVTADKREQVEKLAQVLQGSNPRKLQSRSPESTGSSDAISSLKPLEVTRPSNDTSASLGDSTRASLGDSTRASLGDSTRAQYASGSSLPVTDHSLDVSDLICSPDRDELRVTPSPNLQSPDLRNNKTVGQSRNDGSPSHAPGPIINLTTPDGVPSPNSFVVRVESLASPSRGVSLNVAGESLEAPVKYGSEVQTSTPETASVTSIAHRDTLDNYEGKANDPSTYTSDQESFFSVVSQSPLQIDIHKRAPFSPVSKAKPATPSTINYNVEGMDEVTTLPHASYMGEILVGVLGEGIPSPEMIRGEVSGKSIKEDNIRSIIFPDAPISNSDQENPLGSLNEVSLNEGNVSRGSAEYESPRPLCVTHCRQMIGPTNELASGSRPLTQTDKEPGSTTSVSIPATRPVDLYVDVTTPYSIEEDDEDLNTMPIAPPINFKDPDVSPVDTSKDICCPSPDEPPVSANRAQQLSFDTSIAPIVISDPCDISIGSDQINAPADLSVIEACVNRLVNGAFDNLPIPSAPAQD